MIVRDTCTLPIARIAHIHPIAPTVRTLLIILAQGKMKKIIELELDSRIYSKDAIVKCLYWYTAEYKVNIELINENYSISLHSDYELDLKVINELEKKLNQDLVDYNLRDIIKKETTPIRELIIAKAFSNGEFDEDPKGDLMDPLGIKFL